MTDLNDQFAAILDRLAKLERASMRQAQDRTPGNFTSGLVLFGSSTGKITQDIAGASGTWNPTYIGLTTAGTTTYTTQEGSYMRLGRTVIAHGRVVWTAATGTGAAIVSIPLTAIFTRVSRFPVYIYPVNITFPNGDIIGVIDSGTSAGGFVINSPATNAAGTILAVEAAGDLAFTAIYDVA